MPVTCPHCSTRYVLPKALLGPGGARVRCPRCREPFAVSPEGEAIPPAKPGENGAPASTGVVAESANDAPATVSEPVKRIPAAHAPYAPPAPVEVMAEEKKAEPMEVPAAAPATTAAASSNAAPAVIETPHTVARAVLDELSQHSGEAMAASRDAGRLFREFGPVIAEAFEFYRRQVGPGADAAPFRAALREKWGVDLDPGHPTGRLS